MRSTPDFSTEQHLDDGVLEREFTLGEVPGLLWTAGTEPSPLVLMGHNGGLHKRLPRLVARARQYVTGYGFAVVAVDAPGHGDRPRSPADERARTDFREAMAAGEPIDEIVDAYLLPLVEQAVPEWRATLDAVVALPEVAGPVGYDGMAAIGIALALAEPRVRAAVLFGMGAVPRRVRDASRQLTIPLQLLLQWDDEGMDRQPVLELFDTFGSPEKTLHANVGGHAGTPWFEADDGARFLTRHLREPRADQPVPGGSAVTR